MAAQTSSPDSPSSPPAVGADTAAVAVSDKSATPVTSAAPAPAPALAPTPAPAPSPAAAPPPPPVVAIPVAARPLTMGVQEWCARKSGSDRRVELLAAFHAEQIRTGHAHDTAGNFDNRFAAFVSRPVA